MTFAILAVTTACAPQGPDTSELATLPLYRAIPKASPRSFVTTFDRFCLGYLGKQETLADALRGASFVEWPAKRRLRTFVVDDTRPLVAFGTRAGTEFCAVSAVSRTGQTEAVDRFVAETFPGARPIDASSIGQSTEQAWLTSSDPVRIVFTMREPTAERFAHYSLAITSRSPGTGGT